MFPNNKNHWTLKNTHTHTHTDEVETWLYMQDIIEGF